MRSKPSSRLEAVVAALEQIAPPELAEEWDNVGLLVEPARAGQRVRRIVLTIDLTEPVLEEALARHAELIVAYHPPIFTPLLRLTRATPTGRMLLAAVGRGVAIYSPHTALDSAPGGLNDWLADGLGAGLRRSLLPPRASCEFSPSDASDSPVAGQGREVHLSRAVTLATLVRRIKEHLGLAKLRVARAERHAGGEAIGSVALCAGAGSSVLMDASADLLLTGEMKHHDVLAALASGRSVILCEHSSSERGYLPVLGERLSACLGGDVAVTVSRRDNDPMVIR